MRVLLAAVVVMGVGCSDSAKVESLQSDVERLEHKVSELVEISGDMLDSQSKFMDNLKANIHEKSESTTKVVEAMQESVDAQAEFNRSIYTRVVELDAHRDIAKNERDILFCNVGKSNELFMKLFRWTGDVSDDDLVALNSYLESVRQTRPSGFTVDPTESDLHERLWEESNAALQQSHAVFDLVLEGPGITLTPRNNSP